MSDDLSIAAEEPDPPLPFPGPATDLPPLPVRIAEAASQEAERRKAGGQGTGALFDPPNLTAAELAMGTSAVDLCIDAAEHHGDHQVAALARAINFDLADQATSSPPDDRLVLDAPKPTLQ